MPHESWEYPDIRMARPVTSWVSLRRRTDYLLLENYSFEKENGFREKVTLSSAYSNLLDGIQMKLPRIEDSSRRSSGFV